MAFTWGLHTFPLCSACRPDWRLRSAQEAAVRDGGGEKIKWGKIYKPPRCEKWHGRLNVMLLVTASVADRLVGCWPERDCLPVCCRSRPYTLSTSATEQQTIQQPRGPTGQLDGTACHTQLITCMQFLQRMQHFLYSSHCPSFVLHFRDRCFVRGMIFTVGPGSGRWIHLTMQFKEIHMKKWKKEEQWYQYGTFWLFPNEDFRLSVIYLNHASIDLFYLFTYLLLDLFFYLKENYLVNYLLLDWWIHSISW